MDEEMLKDLREIRYSVRGGVYFFALWSPAIARRGERYRACRMGD